jgi:hypothetical protein
MPWPALSPYGGLTAAVAPWPALSPYGGLTAAVAPWPAADTAPRVGGGGH